MKPESLDQAQAVLVYFARAALHAHHTLRNELRLCCTLPPAEHGPRDSRPVVCRKHRDVGGVLADDCHVHNRSGAPVPAKQLVEDDAPNAKPGLGQYFCIVSESKLTKRIAIAGAQARHD
jgi:hypothetical protein